MFARSIVGAQLRLGQRTGLGRYWDKSPHAVMMGENQVQGCMLVLYINVCRPSAVPSAGRAEMANGYSHCAQWLPPYFDVTIMAAKRSAITVT